MDKVKKILLKRLEDIQKAYQDYKNNPFDTERAHDLRVSVRKLRGLLSFLKPVIAADAYILLNQSLRVAAQIYGPVRELDVLLEVCGDIALEEPRLTDDYSNLFNYLHTERRKEMRRTQSVTNANVMEETLATAKNKIEELSFTEEDIDWSTFTAKRLTKMMKRLEEKYDQLDFSDHAVVHGTRIRAKKIRYATNDFGKLTDIKVKKMNQKAEHIQDTLGHYTDLHVNAALLDRYAEKTDKQELQDLFTQMSELQKERRAAL